MHKHRTPEGLAEHATINRAVLDLMLDLDRQRPWAEDEIARTFSVPGDVRESLRRLRACKLIHRWNDLAVAAHAAVRFHEITQPADGLSPGDASERQQMHRCASAVSALCKFVGRFGALGVSTPCDDRSQHRRRQGRRVRALPGVKDVEPERGDYYLSPGRGAHPGTRPVARLARHARAPRDRGLHRRGPGLHRADGGHATPGPDGGCDAEGANGGRGGGIDLTFSAPKSVSAVWALGDESQRREIEAAHAAAVSETMAHLTETVPTVRRRYHGQVFEEPAVDVVAAEYRHTTARGVIEGDAPDPQLHSHVVITSAVRDDGQIVAVASRPIFRSARELGAYYRSALAHELQQRGYAIERGTGKHGRYFEIAGVPRGLLDAFSSRSREVARAAERFRAKWGRAPERGELRQLKLENRKAKVLITRADLQRAWNDTAARFDFAGEQPGRLLGATVEPPPRVRLRIVSSSA